MTKSPFNLNDTSITDDWIKNTEDGHPVLCVPHDDGALLVIGTKQAFKEMTPKQQIELGAELIKRAVQRYDKLSSSVWTIYKL